MIVTGCSGDYFTRAQISIIRKIIFFFNLTINYEHYSLTHQFNLSILFSYFLTLFFSQKKKKISLIFTNFYFQNISHVVLN